ncbi:MAG: DUF3570 domain-containing protein [Psychrosphaera sp.]|nr:DUF3570 domain-containing protein [Psychrosphaera sp.]
MNIKNKLQALAAAALALPGIAGADEGDNQYQFGYRFHSYSEDALSAEQTGNQPVERYEVRANQFNLSAEVGDDLSLNLAYQHENMAGASAWFTRKDQNGKVIQVMSGASISDSRQDFKLNGAYKLEDKQIGLSIATSQEDDYESLSFGANISYDFDNKLSTFSLAADVSNDDVTPTDSDLFNYRVVSESKRSTSILAGWSRIINKSSIFQVSIGYTDKNGYLSDPYKQVFVNFDLLNDTRPTSRTSKTLSVRYRLSLKSTGGTLHGDYRYYTDSWDIDSHTYELSYYQPLGWDMQLIPSIRLYKQDAAFFYQHYYDQVSSDGLHSTDYRLSAYGAQTLSLTLRKKFDSMTWHLKAQQYASGKDKAFASYNDANPALLDFTLFSAGVDFKF